MGATGTRCTGCGFEASNRKSLKKHVTTHVYVYICRCGFSSYWLDSVQKHAKACLSTDNIAYRVDADSFFRKVSCGCSLEEHPGLPMSTLRLLSVTSSQLEAKKTAP